MRGSVLILAGTAEARAVCGAVSGCRVLASLAGVTRAPRDLGVPVRVGGFGGEAGFRAALDGVPAVLDATHPFAARITARAVRVCAAMAVPYLRLTRPGWPDEPGWTRHATLADCAGALPTGARVFAAVGPGGLGAFLGRGLEILCRGVDGGGDAADGVTWIAGLPSGDAEVEAETMRGWGVTHLATRDSGGARGKLDAARALGVAVHLIDRPPPAPGEETHDVARAIAFVRAHADHRV